MKKDKLIHYARLVISHADAPWVTSFFFFIFFVDTFLIFLPCDTFLGTTVALRPERLKKWLFASVSGVVVGLGLVVLLSNTYLNGVLHDWINSGKMYGQVTDILRHAQNYGFFELTIGVFTVVPCVVG